MNNPLVSVIVPCYNQVQYLAEALQSVLDQTYTNWECIIVNDGSPDNTHEVAQEWLAKDTRFKYIKIDNSGVSNARNVGIESAIGKFILPLDGDDKISIKYVELAVTKFLENDELTLVYCKARKFGDVDENWVLKDFSLQKLALDNMIFCTAMYKKEDWLQVGGYDVEMNFGLEDWEFWIALLKNKGKVFRLEEIGFYYRIKNSSRQTDLNFMDKSDLFKYLSIKHADFFVAEHGSFITLSNKIRLLEGNNYKNVIDKKKALKIFLKAFFGLDYFKIK